MSILPQLPFEKLACQDNTSVESEPYFASTTENVMMEIMMKITNEIAVVRAKGIGENPGCSFIRAKAWHFKAKGESWVLFIGSLFICYSWSL